MSDTPNIDAANLPKQLTTWLSGIVQSCHKEAAVVLGALGATGVVGFGNVKSGLLLGYAALSYFSEKFLNK